MFLKYWASYILFSAWRVFFIVTFLNEGKEPKLTCLLVHRRNWLNEDTKPKLTCLLVHGRNWLKVYLKDLSSDQSYLIYDSYLINDSFYLANFSEIYNFADGTTFHACHNDLNNLIKRLEHKVFLALEWFETNNMKLSKNKCHLLVSGISIKMFGLKWGIKNLGKCTTNITWNGNRKKSSFWWCDFTI